MADDAVELGHGALIAGVMRGGPADKAGLRADQYSDTLVANWTSQEAIVYNVDKFRELGVAPPANPAALPCSTSTAATFSTPVYSISSAT